MAMKATANEFLSIIVRVAKRALCNGKTSAFQADDAGSIPAARSMLGEDYAHIAQSVEHFLGKEEVTGSNPVMSSNAVWRRRRDIGKVGQKAHRREKGGRSQRTE